jgi:predicted RNA binding protein YcfA (HicA-like mRNA interferase family)
MPDKLPVLKAKQVVRALQRAGFYVHHQAGSHVRLLHRSKPQLRVTVPIHSKDIPPSLLSRILKQARLTEQEFADLI